MNGPKRLRISGFEYFDPTGCLASYAHSAFFTPNHNNQDLAWLQERSSSRIASIR